MEKLNKKQLTNEGHRAFFKWLMTDGNCEDSKKVQEYLDTEFNIHPEYFISEDIDEKDEVWIKFLKEVQIFLTTDKVDIRYMVEQSHDFAYIMRKYKISTKIS